MKAISNSKFLLLLLVFISCSISGFGQGKINLSKLDVNKLPAGVKYEGKVKNAVQWKDNLGDNIVITTETGSYPSKNPSEDEESNDADIFAYHYIIKGDKVTLNWQVRDRIINCFLDLELSYIKNTFQVTDLDNNGEAEVWLMYKIGCRSDVCPCDMKIIMYQGQKKHAIRGENKAMIGIDDNGKKIYEGGQYKVDNAFKNSPKVFLEYAKKMWKKNMMDRAN